METYDIYFKEGNDFANKGFSLKDKAKAIRMAEDMLAERKGYVKDFVGGTISVMCKETIGCICGGFVIGGHEYFFLF